MDKLQGLHQKNLSVEEYWQKMVLYIIRAVSYTHLTLPTNREV